MIYRLSRLCFRCVFFFFLFFLFFFFQAEDVIRDLVRSRGLGDVYKRQVHGCPPLRRSTVPSLWESRYSSPSGPERMAVGVDMLAMVITSAAVSYTHLKLPTSDLV